LHWALGSPNVTLDGLYYPILPMAQTLFFLTQIQGPNYSKAILNIYISGLYLDAL